VKKLHPVYWIIPLLAAGGFAILWFDLAHPADPLVVCPVKLVSGLPCPACGSTRSILLALTGHPLEALATNPLGILSGLAGSLCLAWIVFDLVRNTRSFERCYHQAERSIKRKVVYLPLIALLLANWCWNITKDL